MDIQEIFKQLPHRYPFLLVDRVLEVERGKRIRAVKNVSINEPFFQGHFPHYPVMPGVLVIEALAQAAGILSSVSVDTPPAPGSVYFFVGIDNARFRKQVTPGDQLVLEVEIVRHARGLWKYKARGLTDGQVACEADLMCTLREVDPADAPAAA
ncbi:3-hydroxyacyl-ACP dehydratase FabZ [soil metagenome]